MGSCYLKSHSDIPMVGIDSSAAYINSWLSAFKGDKRFVIKAASRAQQAVEYILTENKPKEEEEVLALEHGNN